MRKSNLYFFFYHAAVIDIRGEFTKIIGRIALAVPSAEGNVPPALHPPPVRAAVAGSLAVLVHMP